MKKLLVFLSLVCCVTGIFAQTGHNISVTIKPYKNQYIYLGYHYGKLKALADSVKLNSTGSGVFKGKDKYPGGIYFIVSPHKQILFEVLLDKQQNFSISADSATLPQSVKFTNSTDNSIFQTYSAYVNKKGMEIENTKKEIAATTNPADKERLTNKVRQLNVELTQYRDGMIKQYPNSIIATLFKALREPIVPPAPQQPGGKFDSTYVFLYFKKHYWDGISFTDERLLRTPIFEAKLESYYKSLVVPAPDSIIKEVDAMLLKASPNKEMYKFLLTHFVQQYINPQYMGQDAVFVHLFEKYIANDPKVDWFTDKYKKYITDRAYSLMANLIGAAAQNLDMVDTLEKPRPLYGVEGPFTVICFWDPTCSHCLEVVPKVDSLFQNKWKAAGVRLYGVMVDGGKEAWLKYIRENNLKDWINVYQTAAQREANDAAGKASYKQLYDVFQTPVLYLLDKDKHIIAKKLTYQQLDEVLTLKLKQIQSN
jgi:hypothetical protein